MTVVNVGGVAFGGAHFPVIAGPCSVEPEYVSHAVATAEAGADVLRGSIFKPRSAPNRFEGIGASRGVPLLDRARAETGRPLLAEPLDSSDVEILIDHVDAFLIGARSMRNSRLLTVVGRSGLPVILKRSFSATYQEFLGAAEYVRQTGNGAVVLCERGIRTFVQETRNTLDVSAVPVLKDKTDLPIIVDPSHASGDRRWVLALSMAAAAAGCDGLLVESHGTPSESWTDAPQAINGAALTHLIRSVRGVAKLARQYRAEAPDPG